MEWLLLVFAFGLLFLDKLTNCLKYERHKKEMNVKLHELKTDPEVFQKTYQGVKTFEIRFNDRDFQVGDGLYLRETKYTGEEMKNGKPLEYTGREVHCRITYILPGPAYGLAEGWVIMSVL